MRRIGPLASLCVSLHCTFLCGELGGPDARGKKSAGAPPAADSAGTSPRRLVGDLAVRSTVGRKGDWRGSVTHTVKHINLHGSQAPASRAAAFASHLDQLRQKAVKGGGDKRVEVQHSKGKLTARERLEVAGFRPAHYICLFARPTPRPEWPSIVNWFLLRYACCPSRPPFFYAFQRPNTRCCRRHTPIACCKLRQSPSP